MPPFPVLININGYLYGAKDKKSLINIFKRFLDITEDQTHAVIDPTGKEWTLLVIDRKVVISPININKWTKEQTVNLFNMRKNRNSEHGRIYSLKSLSARTKMKIMEDLVYILEEENKK